MGELVGRVYHFEIGLVVAGSVAVDINYTHT